MTPAFISKAIAMKVITQDQAQELWTLWQNERAKEAEDEARGEGLKLTMAHVLWVGGAAFILLALVFLGFEAAGQNGFVLAALIGFYALGFASGGQWLVTGQRNLTLAACLISTAILLAFIAITVLQDAYLDTQGIRLFSGRSGVNWFADPKGPAVREEGFELTPALLFLSSGLIPAGALALMSALFLWRSRFLPLWVPLIGGVYIVLYESLRIWVFDPSTLKELELLVPLVYGAALLGSALKSDMSSGPNHGFWLNKLGWAFFGVGMSSVYLEGGIYKEVFLLVCCFAVLFSVFTRRPSGISFAALGIATYMADNLWNMFRDDVFLGLLLCTLIGVALIWGGLKLSEHKRLLERIIPEGWSRFRPQVQDDPVTFGF